MEHVTPADIENTSMAIIARELAQRQILLPEEHAPVVRRVIHATADFEFAETLCFSDRAVEKGVTALQRGTPIVTDTNMAFSGISKRSMTELGVEAHCFMAREEIAQRARERGTTRAVAAMQYAAARYPGAIFAVGNAPTALFALCDLMDRGLRPALIVAVPVGFVNVVEGKQRIWETAHKLEIPIVAAMGRKGGSTVAAAILNALLYTATKTLAPEARGWH